MTAPDRSSRQQVRPSLVATHGDLALFLLGLVMVLGGMLRGEAAISAGMVVIGAGLALLAVLLPRLSGTIKITPGSIELNVLERLEATREEAQRRIPDRVDEAVGRAFEALVAEGLLEPVLPSSKDAAQDGAAEAVEPAGRGQRGIEPPLVPSQPSLPTARSPKTTWFSLALLGLGAAALFVVVSVPDTPSVEDGADGPGAQPPPATEPALSPTSTTLTETGVPVPGKNDGPREDSSSSSILGVAALVATATVAVVAVVLVVSRRRHRVETAGPQPDTSLASTTFARRIVDELGDSGPSGTVER